MRHRKEYRKFGRDRSHVHAMFANMLSSLIEHRKLKTTETKARELRRIAEKSVTRFTALGDMLLKDQSKLDAGDRARLVHAIRMTRRRIRNPEAVYTLYNDIAPRYLGRPGGYTRINKIGYRRGDGAPMVLLEFVEAEMPEREGQASSSDQEQKKGFLKRFSRKA